MILGADVEKVGINSADFETAISHTGNILCVRNVLMIY